MKRIELDKDIQPISEFRAHATELLARVNRTKRPLVLTQHGKSSAVVLGVREYEALLDKLELLTELASANRDILHKRTFVTQEVKKMLRGASGGAS